MIPFQDTSGIEIDSLSPPTNQRRKTVVNRLPVEEIKGVEQEEANDSLREFLSN